MEPQMMAGPKTQLPAGKMSAPENTAVPKSLALEQPPATDSLMTSSLVSVTSSLTSPVDSGVQLLDSESDITSVMSMSGTGCDLESSCSYDVPNTMVSNTPVQESEHCTPVALLIEQCPEADTYSRPRAAPNVMTKSDIANQNTTTVCELGVYSCSAPTVEFAKCTKPREQAADSKIELELRTDVDTKPDVDTHLPNVAMHVSVSEEVSEQAVDTEAKPPDEQIVFRRQRKKKSSKSDTPKKRVSFHEDILNSTKIDDIHINHGFITHQPDISMSFFNWDSVRKRDVVKGRYSWAAEGDTPYYQRSAPEREVRSELYMQSRFSSSTSSSSAGSVDSSSSNSLCDTEPSSDGAGQKLPRSSCLKKRTAAPKHIDTHIVHEDGLKGRRSESNLLDSTLFGSLKSMLSFSASVPLAERGVPEGQEDVYTAQRHTDGAKSLEGNESGAEAVTRGGHLNIEVSAKSSLKLGPSDGFYPNYPLLQPLPANVVLCDSNVYEHRGISYSYEYDKFQKSLENASVQKPKSSTVYQMLLRDLNFFKRRDKERSEHDLHALAAATSTPTSEPRKGARSSIGDWSSDTETVSDFSDTGTGSKHLSSPKHKVNRAHHYSVPQSFKAEDAKAEADGPPKFPSLKPATSKSSLINRFLRNVTMKKLLDAKLQKKQRSRTNRCMGLYMRGVQPDAGLSHALDRELAAEVHRGRRPPLAPVHEHLGSALMLKLRKEVFRSAQEQLVNFYKVHTAYAANGDARPLVVFLTTSTLYITGFKPNQSFCNQFVLPYRELNTVLVGPSAHTVHFSNADREMQFLVATGSAETTGALIGQLEMAIRRHGGGNAVLPAVRHLSMREMAQLKAAVLKQTTVDKDEEYFHYSVVNVQDVSAEPASTPLGPIKSGPLMFKTASDIRWETGYFILKGGVLYILSSPSNRLPLRALPLGGGACLGAHRTPYCLRPHTFELLLGSVVLQLAAPDEYVASEWLQVLVQAASGLYGSHEASHTQSCTLLLTSQHILTMRERFPAAAPLAEYTAQALSCAAISDLTAFRIPLAEQSWCILEFACREVHETSGDLVLYFATNTELERFIATLEMLWAYNNIKGDSFPLCTIPEDESISQKCADAYRMLQGAWSAVNVVLQ